MKLERLQEIRTEFYESHIEIEDVWTQGYFSSYCGAICDLLDKYIDLVSDLEKGFK